MGIDRSFGQIVGRDHEGGDFLALWQFGESHNGDVLHSLTLPDDDAQLRTDAHWHHRGR